MNEREKYNALFGPAQERWYTLNDLPMDLFSDQFKMFLHIKYLFEKMYHLYLPL